MRKIINILTAVLVLSGFAACTDILETAPHHQISQGSMWTSESNVDMGVIGVYSSLKNPVDGQGMISEDVKTGHYGYEAFGMTGQAQGPMDQLFASGVTPGNGRFGFTLKLCFDGVHRANDAIAHIPAAPINDTKKGRLLAECKFLRAFFYSRLNELFGSNGVGVPLYTEPVDNPNCNKGQSSEAEVWTQIIQDLTDAINEPNLPNNYISKDGKGEGRVTKGAAYTLRGRAYLMSKEYDKAAADFAKVAECGYKLFPNYQALFKQANENCEEMIFSVQYVDTEVNYGIPLQKHYGAHQSGSKDSRGCWTTLQPTPAAVDLYEVIVDANTVKPFAWEDFLPGWNEVSAVHTKNRRVYFIRDKFVNGEPIHTTVTNVINTELNAVAADYRTYYLPEGNEARLKAAYNNRDPRLACCVVTPYTNFKGVNSNSSAAADYTFRWPVTARYYSDEVGAERNLNPSLPKEYLNSGCTSAQAQFKYMYRKFVGEGLEFNYRMYSPLDEPIFRYADVLLMWAEALVEQNKLSDAMAKVKQVRDRAGIPTMSSSFANQTTARNYVRDEHRREFLGEGKNFFDEMRWKTLKDTKYSQGTPKLIWGGTEAIGNPVYQWPGDFFYTWPVPRGEVEMNPNLAKTPGWTY